MTADGKAFVSNEGFIDGVSLGLDLADSRAVFDHVFSCLPDEARIYPTEGYYYFNFAANGCTVWGSLSLYAHNRDQGIFGFGYSIKHDKYRDVFLPVKGGGATLSAADGVIVEKIEDLKYRVTARAKTVVFTLHVEPLRRPGRLRDDEVFVGPCFDESGLRFFLVFNTAANWLYWILDADHPGHRASFTNLADDIVIEDRTEYAFYQDRALDRLILIGVEGLNVLQNNWYDGPFDQMPDNYVHLGLIEVQKYLEASYPHARGRIDKYGNYLDKPGSRIAVAPYMVYFYRDDLMKMLANVTATGVHGSAFLAAITRQVYDIPPEFRPRWHR